MPNKWADSVPYIFLEANCALRWDESAEPYPHRVLKWAGETGSDTDAPNPEMSVGGRQDGGLRSTGQLIPQKSTDITQEKQKWEEC